jgi:hypothetical protein
MWIYDNSVQLLVNIKEIQLYVWIYRLIYIYNFYFPLLGVGPRIYTKNSTDTWVRN